jgi:hypothetical protein
MQVAIPVAVFLNVFAMIAVFVFKDGFKAVGILLIAIGVITAISISAYGIVALGMFVAAGIVALRYKSRQTTQSIF